jgi:hypothetical protein
MDIGITNELLSHDVELMEQLDTQARQEDIL